MQEGLLPFKYIVADCLYGNSPDFLDAVDACVGRTALVAVPSETRCWLQRPWTEAKRYRYKGAARAKRVVVDPAAHPHGGGFGGEAARLKLVSPARCRKGPKGRSSMRLPANG